MYVTHVVSSISPAHRNQMTKILAECKLQELPVSGYLKEPCSVLCGQSSGDGQEAGVSHTSSLPRQPVWGPYNSRDSVGSFPCLVRYLPPHVPPSHL